VDCPVEQSKFEDLSITFASVRMPEDQRNAGWIASTMVAPPMQPFGYKTWAEKIVAGDETDKWYAEDLTMDDLGRYADIGGGYAVDLQWHGLGGEDSH